MITKALPNKEVIESNIKAELETELYKKLKRNGVIEEILKQLGNVKAHSLTIECQVVRAFILKDGLKNEDEYDKDEVIVRISTTICGLLK